MADGKKKKKNKNKKGKKGKKLQTKQPKDSQVNQILCKHCRRGFITREDYDNHSGEDNTCTMLNGAGYNQYKKKANMSLERKKRLADKQFQKSKKLERNNI
ncbi:uncharacterized protein LOC121051159 [Rosa chinensis]|uniref:uncharacterized protein LOC121051122 n=1 Tax=Rosa chinensis TaxID=74649 RepID=UPI001AD90638|nr:uncharacterized protein LOC121051122 [Rosa chinensis]XP_040369131.1 uncharacterized protein LOC121051159 [Rosa chinensis]